MTRDVRWTIVAAVAAFAATGVAVTAGASRHATSTLMVGGIHAGSVTEVALEQAAAASSAAATTIVPGS